MEKRKLGNSDLEITPIGMGAWAIFVHIIAGLVRPAVCDERHRGWPCSGDRPVTKQITE